MHGPLPNEAARRHVAIDGHPSAWAMPAGTTERKATVVELSSRHTALLRLDDGRTIDAPMLDGIRDRCRLGSPVLAYFDRDGRPVGWYLPEAGIGVELQSG